MKILRTPEARARFLSYAPRLVRAHALTRTLPDCVALDEIRIRLDLANKYLGDDDACEQHTLELLRYVEEFFKVTP